MKPWSCVIFWKFVVKYHRNQLTRSSHSPEKHSISWSPEKVHHIQMCNRWRLDRFILPFCQIDCGYIGARYSGIAVINKHFIEIILTKKWVSFSPFTDTIEDFGLHSSNSAVMIVAVDSRQGSFFYFSQFNWKMNETYKSDVEQLVLRK